MGGNIQGFTNEKMMDKIGCYLQDCVREVNQMEKKKAGTV